MPGQKSIYETFLVNRPNVRVIGNEGNRMYRPGVPGRGKIRTLGSADFFS